MVVKFGIIGTGAIAASSYRDISSHDGAEVVAISGSNQARLNKLGDTMGVSKRYASSRDIIADPDVDALYIAVPNVFHAPLAEEALDAGKHVILDKPFALSKREALIVAEATRRSGKLFTLAMNLRFDPGAQKIRSLVAAGALGEVYHSRATWRRRAGIPRLGTWFGHKAMSGGGSLIDIGVHVMDLALYLIDNFDAEAVSGATFGRFGQRGLGEGGWGLSSVTDLAYDVDDFATALIKLKGGACVSVDVSWALHQGQANVMNVELHGTDAGAGVFPAELYRFGTGPGEYQVIQNPAAPPTHSHQSRFHNFINAINGDEPLCVTLDQAVAVQGIIDAIYASCATGAEIRLGS